MVSALPCYLCGAQPCTAVRSVWKDRAHLRVAICQTCALERCYRCLERADELVMGERDRFYCASCAEASDE